MKFLKIVNLWSMAFSLVGVTVKKCCKKYEEKMFLTVCTKFTFFVLFSKEIINCFINIFLHKVLSPIFLILSKNVLFKRSKCACKGSTPAINLTCAFIVPKKRPKILYKHFLCKIFNFSNFWSL